MIKILQHWLAFVALCVIACAPQYAQADGNKEYLVKAAFLYNFVKFVEWPDGKAIAQQSHIDICVIGDSPMSETGSIFKSASTPKLSLSLVKESSAKNAATHCHIAFIAQSEQGHLNDVLGALKGHPVLTVSDIEDFASHGGMIGFVMNDDKIKVEVNTKSTAASSMRVDAQLLEIALRVIDK